MNQQHQDERTRIRQAMDRLPKRRGQHEFYERVRTETQQVPEHEQELRETIATLKKTIANQNAELQELVTSLTLAGAVLTHTMPTLPAPTPPPDNVFTLRPRPGLIPLGRFSRRLGPG
ncbi:hypothetical protein [Nonomuraea sp. B19D2]|uniref:hypothetical protein n=1 Tax=Nonomuraea sp. B19D2 TaxID=3159561 RepID=UPI0032DAB3A1